MEHKIAAGSRTLAIDGKPVGRPRTRTTRGDSEMQRGLKRYPTKDASATAEQRRLARFAVRIAMRLHRNLVGNRDVDIQFFEPDGKVNGLAPKHRSTGRYVKLAANLDGEDLAETALHEARHVIQTHGPEGMTSAEREADAEGFARRWLPAVMKAFRVSDGELSRVTLCDRPPPIAGAIRGRVVIERKTGRVHDYDPRRTQSAWREIRT